MKKVFGKALCFLLLVVCESSIYGQKVGSLPDRIPYRKGNKWGFCDRNKKIIIPVSFDDVRTFGETPVHLKIKVPDTLAWVKKGTKDYLINRAGKLRSIEEVELPKKESMGELPPMGMSLPADDKTREIFRDPASKKFGLIYGRDTVLTARFDYIYWDRHNELYEVRAKLNGKWGILDVKPEKWKVEPSFDEIERLFEVQKNGVECNAYKVSNKGKVGVIVNNNLIIPTIYTDVFLPYSRNTSLICMSDKIGNTLYDIDGKKLTTEPYERLRIDAFYWFTLSPAQKNGKWGFINRDGKLVIPCKYDECDYFIRKITLCWVKYKGKRGLIDAKGTEYFED
ncbi:WG repeat-containing protein [Niastella caeni]|uniref:WG repeat-containing protein n=1 Tax=Niastella caeni TaxID=2569763 RepID=A0A4S8I332_9BACT|nr:WG repeat-containing protein [Niastella caeni]THU41254.1 WG repeat-containing protein [Niastella caeni]